MNAETLILMLPYSTAEERNLLSILIQDKTEEESKQFMTSYILQRKDPQQILILSLLGLCCFAGIQRFALDEVLMGLLYFFTCGFCFIGTIMDIVRYKELTFEYNRKMANLVYQSVNK
jgi:TM2 domain-containing membrane protein YozV